LDDLVSDPALVDVPAGPPSGGHRLLTGRFAIVKRDPRMGDAPTLFELMDQYKTPHVVRAVARIVLASGDFGRPMVAGPGNPPERIKLMRDAYAKAMHDPALIEEAKKSQMDMEHTPGEELQTLMKELMNQPREVIERVKRVLSE
jgi:hypothetical protein